MLKKIMLLGCLLALFLGAGCGKETNKTEQVHVASYPGWVEIQAGDQGSFAVPPEMILQSQETRDGLLKAPDLDPLLKKWLEADQEVVKSPGFPGSGGSFPEAPQRIPDPPACISTQPG